MLQLPPELRLMIFRLLQRDDLLTCLTVCKEMTAFVHPLFYEHMVFNKAGMAFPHAPNPYPLLDIPNLKVIKPVPEDERERIVTGIRDVTILPHPFHACTSWLNLQDPRRPAEIEVLTIQLAFPSLDGMACCHRPLNCGCCGRHGILAGDSDSDTDDSDSEERAGHPFPNCAYVEALEDTKVKKLVLKNYPVLLHGENPSVLPTKMLETMSSLVVVLSPTTLTAFNPYDDYYFADPCPGEGAYAGVNGLMNMIPPNVTDLTLIFWTPLPSMEWAPDCKHYSSEWYDNGCTTPCPCGGGCHGHPFSFDDEDIQQSCWQDEFWPDLAAGVAKLNANVTLVNYSSIVPDEAHRYVTLNAMRSNRKRPTIRQTFLKELRKATKERKRNNPERKNRGVRLLSMESWMRTGAWEDVFDRKTMRAWLERLEKADGQPSKEKSSKAAKSKQKQKAKEDEQKHKRKESEEAAGAEVEAMKESLTAVLKKMVVEAEAAE